MRIIDIHQVRTHLSRLVERAAQGEAFVAKAGGPLVKVVPLAEGEAAGTQRLGFLPGTIKVPEDFDRMGARQIERLFRSGK